MGETKPTHNLYLSKYIGLRRGCHKYLLIQNVFLCRWNHQDGTMIDPDRRLNWPKKEGGCSRCSPYYIDGKEHKNTKSIKSWLEKSWLVFMGWFMAWALPHWIPKNDTLQHHTDPQGPTLLVYSKHGSSQDGANLWLLLLENFRADA